MERGTVKSYDKNCGMGVIGRSGDADVNFYKDSIVGRDRVAITPGDAVWFEVDNVKNLHVAINVRKA